MKKGLYCKWKIMLLGFLFGFITTFLMAVIITGIAPGRWEALPVALLVVELPVFGFLAGIEIRKAVSWHKAWVKGYMRGRREIESLADELARRLKDNT